MIYTFIAKKLIIFSPLLNKTINILKYRINLKFTNLLFAEKTAKNDII